MEFSYLFISVCIQAYEGGFRTGGSPKRRNRASVYQIGKTATARSLHLVHGAPSWTQTQNQQAQTKSWQTAQSACTTAEKRGI